MSEEKIKEQYIRKLEDLSETLIKIVHDFVKDKAMLSSLLLEETRVKTPKNDKNSEKSELKKSIK